MDFEGFVHLVLPLVTGQSARGEWKKQEVIFELPGEFNRKVCVAFWNDRADSAGALRVGEKIAVSTNVQSQERNGRWYTEVRGWRFTRVAEQSNSGQQFNQNNGVNQQYQEQSTNNNYYQQQPANNNYYSQNNDNMNANNQSQQMEDDLPF